MTDFPTFESVESEFDQPQQQHQPQQEEKEPNRIQHTNGNEKEKEKASVNDQRQQHQKDEILLPTATSPVHFNAAEILSTNNMSHSSSESSLSTSNDTNRGRSFTSSNPPLHPVSHADDPPVRSGRSKKRGKEKSTESTRKKQRKCQPHHNDNAMLAHENGYDSADELVDLSPQLNQIPEQSAGPPTTSNRPSESVLPSQSQSAAPGQACAICFERFTSEGTHRTTSLKCQWHN